VNVVLLLSSVVLGRTDVPSVPRTGVSWCGAIMLFIGSIGLPYGDAIGQAVSTAMT
jgi:hypothetical protein